MTVAARRLVLAVLFADQLVDLGGVGGVDQAFSELVVLQQARDPRQRLQMKTRGVLRRYQHEKDVRRIAVERVEINAAAMPPEGTDDLRDPAHLPVRNCDPVPDRGRTQTLALAEDRGQLFKVDIRKLCGEALSQFPEYLVLGGSLQIGKDHFR